MASALEDVPMSDDMDFEDDVEAELEVDELDPSDDEQQPTAAPASKGKSRKASTGKPGVRVPGHTLLPATRIEGLLQSSGITSSALGMSKEGQFMLSIATEEFIKLLAKRAYENAQQDQSNMVRYEDVALVPKSYPAQFDFVQDIIPRPMSLKYALEFRQQKQQELLDQDPSLGGSIGDYLSSALFVSSEGASSSISASTSTTTKPKKPKASTNGKEKQANGSGDSVSGRQKKSASARSSRSASASSTGTPVEEPPTVKLPSRPSRKSLNGLISASHLAAKPVYPSPLANGHVKSDSPDPEAMDDTPLGDVQPRSPIGPGSGFLGQEFASRSASVSSSTDNPGRTIYSQPSQPD